MSRCKTTRIGILGVLVLGFTAVNLPQFGGTLVPSPDILIPQSGNGTRIDWNGAALAGLPRGARLWFQAAFLDSAATQGLAMSDGLHCIIP